MPRLTARCRESYDPAMDRHAEARGLATPPRPGEVSLVLVDFDDTLVVTAPRFQNARRALAAHLVAQGFDEALIWRVHHDEVDPEMRRLYGLGPFRLEPAFRATYHRLCALAGRIPDPAVEEECAALGRGVAGTPPCVEGALEALDRLARVYPTIVYTQSGHPDDPFQVVRESAVLDVLPPERVRVCAHKDEAEFRRTLRVYGVDDPGTAWMIGNSVRADINPALQAGARAILVEAEDPWQHDLVDPVSADFVRVPRFPDAVDFLLSGLG